MKKILLLFAVAPLLLHAAVIYETDFASAEGWTPWKVSKEALAFGKDGFSLELEQRNSGFSGIRREIPAGRCSGYLKLSATFSADNVLPGKQGPKIQALLQFPGKAEYPGVKTPAGSYPERRAERVFFCGNNLRKLFLHFRYYIPVVVKNNRAGTRRSLIQRRNEFFHFPLLYPVKRRPFRACSSGAR